MIWPVFGFWSLALMLSLRRSDMFIDQEQQRIRHSFGSAMLTGNYDRKSNEFYKQADRHRAPKGVQMSNLAKL